MSDAEGMARAAVDLAATSPLTVDDAMRVIAEAARLLEAADIVRDLAASDPLAGKTLGTHAGFGRDVVMIFCVHCRAEIEREPLRPGVPPAMPDHHENCSWRRAVEWVSTQEGQT